MNANDKIEFIRRCDPEGAARLDRLFAKKDSLKEGNVYRERFTDRQFSLVFMPLVDAAFERAVILDILSNGDDTIPGISEKTNIGKDRVFEDIKELIKRNLVEMAGHKGRDAIFRKKRANG